MKDQYNVNFIKNLGQWCVCPILAFSIAASLALSIAACSKTDNTTAVSQTTAESTITESTTTETTTVESSSEESTETESTAASETVVITADDIRINEEKQVHGLAYPP